MATSSSTTAPLSLHEDVAERLREELGALGFRHRDDIVEISKILAALGIEINVTAPMGARSSPPRATCSASRSRKARTDGTSPRRDGNTAWKMPGGVAQPGSSCRRWPWRRSSRQR